MFCKNHALDSSDVQFGQRTALIGIAVKQKGQSLVVGAAGGTSFFRCIWLMIFTNKNTAKAIMRKVIMLLINKP
jgi:hypothetical protein